MEYLPPNVSAPVSFPWTQTPLIRTGCPTDGSCFFHAVFMAYRSFRDLSSAEKVKYITRKRAKLADAITLQSWLSIQEGAIAQLQIMVAMQEFLSHSPQSEHVRAIIHEHRIDARLFEMLSLIVDPREMVEKHIMPQWDNACSRTEHPFNAESFVNRMKSEWYHLHYDAIVRRINALEDMKPPQIMTMEQKSKVIHKLCGVTYDIFDMIQNIAFHRFKSEIGDYGAWIDLYSFLYIVPNFDLTANIIFIDATTQEFFQGMRMIQHHIDVSKPFVILLYYPDSHFESIGKVSRTEETHSVSRIFTAEDEIIIEYMQSFLEETQ